jgi:hypothetical protein
VLIEARDAGRARGLGVDVSVCRGDGQRGAFAAAGGLGRRLYAVYGALLRVCFMPACAAVVGKRGLRTRTPASRRLAVRPLTRRRGQ